MKNKLLLTWLLIAGVLITSLYLVTPVSRKIRLGLDLQGGYSFDVELDKSALEETIRERYPEANDDEIKRRLADASASADETAVDIIRQRIDSLGTEEPVITKGKNGRIYVQIPGASEKQRDRAEQMVKSVAALDFRLVSVQSARLAAELLNEGKAPHGYRVVDLPQIGLCYVRDESVPEPDPASLRNFGKAPASYIFALERVSVDPLAFKPIFVERRARMTGEYLTKSSVQYDDMGRLVVALSLNDEGTKKFADITRRYNEKKLGIGRGRQLAIVLDGIVRSAPVLKDTITGGHATISGSFTRVEAQDLKNVLNAGAMPAPLKFLGKRFVNPTLGEDSISDASKAIVVGTLAVILFMIWYYRALGLVADLALVLNFLLTPLCAVLAAGILSQFSSDATISTGSSFLSLPVLTLPGIAGLLLTVGMAVDANVLIFERTREELMLKKPAYPSIMAGYQRAFSAIFDGNLTTVITGIILFMFGTGVIRGFSITLVAGIIASMFTALVVTKAVFQSTVKESSLWKPKMQQFVSESINIPFLKNAKKFSSVAIAIIIVTVAITIIRGVSNPSSVFAIDFTGGARISYKVTPNTPASAVEAAAVAEASEAAAEAAVEAASDATEAVVQAAAETTAEAPALSREELIALLPDTGAIRKAAEAAGITDANPQYQYSEDENAYYLNIQTVMTELNGVEISSAITAALQNKDNADLAKATFTYQDIDSIGSQIGNEMKRTAFIAIALSSLAMLLYIGFRFEFVFGFGAIAALVHDVLITIGIFSCLGFQFSLTIVAAMLTIVGYGVNDTIVLFDRVREEIRRDQKTDFPELVNRCINQTLSRTVLTSITTLLPVLSLIVFCRGDIQAFAVCMLIGIIVSTFSTVFIASPVMLFCCNNKRPDFRKSSNN